MNRISSFAGCLAILGFASANASNVATQTITFSIQPITEISISGDPPAFNASQAVAGSGPSDVTDSSTFYSVTSNGTSEQVFASLDSAMPTGTQLCLMASPPTGAVSTGIVMLDVSNQSIVTGITQVAQSNLQLSYVFESTVQAGILPSTTRVVTLTLSP